MIPQGGVDYSHISERAHITAASNLTWAKIIGAVEVGPVFWGL
jgi:hypothetical protein